MREEKKQYFALFLIDNSRTGARTMSFSGNLLEDYI